MINRNDLAKEISIIEGKKQQVNIAQIKEVLRCTLKLLSNYGDKDIAELLNEVRVESKKQIKK